MLNHADRGTGGQTGLDTLLLSGGGPQRFSKTSQRGLEVLDLAKPLGLFYPLVDFLLQLTLPRRPILDLVPIFRLLRFGTVLSLPQQLLTEFIAPRDELLSGCFDLLPILLLAPLGNRAGGRGCHLRAGSYQFGQLGP